MTRIERLINHGNIRSRLIASDMDGTLLWGDLGETVFFLALAMDAAGMRGEDAAAFLDSLNGAAEVACGENPGVSGAIQGYLDHLRRGELVEAYTLIDRYLRGASAVDMLPFSRMILERGIPRQKLTLRIGYSVFPLRIHVELDALMTCLLKDSASKGAEIRIISGSPQALVEGYCLFQGLPACCARGVSQKPGGGVVVPYGSVKLEILAEEGYTRPFIAVGNSPGDFEMLRAAEHAFVRKSSPREALDEARRNHWELI